MKVIDVSKNGMAEVMLGMLDKQTSKVMKERKMKRYIKNCVPGDIIRVSVNLEAHIV